MVTTNPAQSGRHLKPCWPGAGPEPSPSHKGSQGGPKEGGLGSFVRQQVALAADTSQCSTTFALLPPHANLQASCLRNGDACLHAACASRAPPRSDATAATQPAELSQALLTHGHSIGAAARLMQTALQRPAVPAAGARLLSLIRVMPQQSAHDLHQPAKLLAVTYWISQTKPRHSRC